MIFENFRSSQKSRPSRLVPPDVPLASSHHEETTMAAVSAVVAKHKIVNEFILKIKRGAFIHYAMMNHRVRWHQIIWCLLTTLNIFV